MRASGFTVVEEFFVGSILSRSLAVLTARPLLFLIPPAMFLAVAGLVVASFGAPYYYMGLLLLLLYVLGILAQASVAYAVYQTLLGEPVTLWQSLVKALPRVPALFFVSLLTGFCIGLGFLLLIVPGILLSAAWVVAVQACVIERASLMTCIKRSEALTKGHRLKIAGLIIMITLVGWFITDAGFLPFFLRGLGLPGWVAVAGYALVRLILTAFSSVMYAVIYFDLRTIDEGLPLGRLGRVFD